VCSSDLFEHSEKDYLFIPTFAKHQHPHKKERDNGTDLPDPDALELRPASEQYQRETRRASGKTRSIPGQNPVSTGPGTAVTVTGTDTNTDAEGKPDATPRGSAADVDPPSRRLDEILLDPRDCTPFVFPCLRTPATPTGETTIPIKKAREWDSTYGRKFDILDDIRNCRQWVMDNPSRRKHPGKNTIVMIGNWLRRTDRHGSGKPPMTLQERQELKRRMDAARAADREVAQRAAQAAHRGGDCDGAPVGIGELLGDLTGSGTDCDVGK
jgi:hypothetical protein